jgi:hypothetical protein
MLGVLEIFLKEKWLREENARLKELLRESLNKTGDGAWHRKVYEALGEPMPPLRKLKGKIPRYQLNGDSPSTA